MQLIVCGNCGPKFAGFFTEADKRKKYDSMRRCIACHGKQSKISARRRSRGLAGLVRVPQRTQL